MRAEDFTNAAPGRLTPTIGGNLAFVPDPLPPAISYGTKLVELIAQAEADLGALRGIGEQLPNPHLLIAPYVRREAVLSSKIEGTVATLAEIFRVEADSTKEAESGDVHEVRNYVSALEEGLRLLGQLPLSLRLVKDLHRILMRHVRGAGQSPGEFRRDQNYIAPPGTPIADATFIPPPVPEMTQALAAWEKFLHLRVGVPVLVQCSLLHYQFEAIHPFRDGNGRVGRLLITLFLCERGRLRLPLLYLSAYFERHRREYYDRLLEVSRRGDWDGWISFFLQGVASQSRTAARHATSLLDLRAAFRTRLQNVRVSASTLAVLDKLFENPYTTARRVAEVVKASPTTAQKIIDRLQKAGILREVTGQKWGRIYCAQKLLRLLERPPGEVEEDARASFSNEAMPR